MQSCLDELLPGGIAGTAARPRYSTRESVSLAFVAALQHLPPGQRAVLLLRDVEGFTAAETADILGTGIDSADQALTRARAAMAQWQPARQDRLPPPGSRLERRTTARFADAFEHGDVPAIIALLTDDASITMPPLPSRYQGQAAAAEFLADAFARGRRHRLIATRANRQPAFGCYLRDPHAPTAHADGLIVLTLTDDRIRAVTHFTDSSLLPLFGLPRTLP